VSRDYHAKRLAKEQGIPYAEALRRVRQAREAQPPAEGSSSPIAPEVTDG
jgi:hypothetical protein